MISRHDLYYLLGFGFNDFYSKDGLVLSKPNFFKKLMQDISFLLFKRDQTIRNQSNLNLTIEDEEIVKFLNQHGVTTPKKYMPSISEEYAWSFIAGYFDGYGDFSFKNGNTRITINSNLPDLINFISKVWKVNNNPHADKVIANGYKALDICGFMYKDVSIKNSQKYSAFWEVLNFSSEKPTINTNFDYMKLHPKAVAPKKTYVTDSGYDLHIISLTKLYGSVYQGKTELAIKPILGYAFDVNGRSSLPKSGWMFMQGTGICDRSYTGGIQATFMKLNDEPLPNMPWKALQIIPRTAPIHAEFNEKKNLGESFRGEGGFGSTS